MIRSRSVRGVQLLAPPRLATAEVTPARRSCGERERLEWASRLQLPLATVLQARGPSDKNGDGNMQAALIETDGEGDGTGGVDALEDVTLEHFTANPTAIGPFDHSTLSWHVNGVGPRVQILLDNTQVTAVGNAVVNPAVTAGFTLSAKSGAARKTLGHVTVNVETSTCEEVELLNLLAALRQQVILAIANRADTYWSGNLDDPNILSVSLSDEPLPRIQLRAVFRQRLAYFPDPWVTLEVSFGLTIQNGVFVAVAPSSSGTVEFDKLTWFLGGILLGLALAFSKANERATKAGTELIAGLLQYINVVQLHPSAHKMPRSAVVTHRNGHPFIGYVECSVGKRGVTVVLSDVAAAMS
jgi:hypothetical protein